MGARTDRPDHSVAPNLRSSAAVRSRAAWAGSSLAKSAPLAEADAAKLVFSFRRRRHHRKGCKAAPIFGIYLRPVIHQKLNHGIVSPGCRAMQRGIAGLVGRVDIAAQIERGFHGFENLAFRLYLPEIDHVDATAALFKTRSHADRQHERRSTVRHCDFRIRATGYQRPHDLRLQKFRCQQIGSRADQRRQ